MNKKIRNFGNVTFNSSKKQIEYSWFEKQSDGQWKEFFGQKTIYNEVFFPNTEAVIKTIFGKPGGLKQDLWGNEILIGTQCDFYDRNPPDVVKRAGRSFSSDIKPTVKFLAENFEFDAETDEVPPLRTIYLDIETKIDDQGFLEGWDAGCDRGGVLLISCFDNIDNKTTVFGIKPYSHDTTENQIKYVYCDDERTLMREFVKYLKKQDPKIISGWACANYDLPYLINRLNFLFGNRSLSHFGNARAWIKNEAKRFVISGISIIDYMVLYKKFELKPRRSYALANICEEEDITISGEGKHKIEGSMKDFSEKQWDKFVEYCIQDTKLVYEIDNKKKLMDTFIMLCYMAGIPFDSAISLDISWLRIHDAAIYRYCKSKNKELPTIKNTSIENEDHNFVGAYIMSPHAGLYKYVTVFDVASLYPSCIRSLNISIDSYRGKVINIITSGDKTKKLINSDGVFTDDFQPREGKYEIEIYDPLYLSLKEFLPTLIESANQRLIKKIDPKIMMPKRLLFNNGNELIVFLKTNNLCIAANGTIFTTQVRGVIPSLLDDWISIRKRNKTLYFENKKKYQETGNHQYKQTADRYKTIQEVYKIRLNSLYGKIGCRYSRFFDTDLAEAVTLTGQFILKSTMNALRNYNPFFKAIYCDTDSIFLNYEDILKRKGIDLNNAEACVAACLDIDKEVQTVINTHLNKITKDTMNTPNHYSFDSEEVYDKLLITSKKKYIARTLYDKVNNNFLTNDYNIKGMEFKKSNLSKPVKDMLKDITIKIMDGMTEEKTLERFKEIWLKLSEYPIDDISFAQKVEGLQKYGLESHIEIQDAKRAIVAFPKHCPYHVTGTLAMNALIEWDNDLREMTKVSNGDKAKIVFVTPKNLFGVEAVVFTGKWNPKLYEYFKLDVEKIFLRLVLQPLQPVLDAMKFKINLDSILGFKFLDSENNYQQMLLF